MAGQRRKKGRAISGWLVFDKPIGMGSTEAVSRVRWLFGAQKAGHAGTLDPLASGMLPIALGEATKTVPYVMDGVKVYEFTVAWGEERSTDDLEGEVVAQSDRRPSRAEIEALLPRFTGIIQQVPPRFSAVKIDGERAYDLARAGETLEIAPREVEILRLEISAMPDEDHTSFLIECGKGTYVRSLARDMGRLLGCHGHVSELRRTEVEPFSPDELVTPEMLEAASPRTRDPNAIEGYEELDALLLETGAALDGLPHVALGDDAAARIRLGNPVILRGRDAPVEAEEAYATCKGRLVAIGAIEAGQFKPGRVFRG